MTDRPRTHTPRRIRQGLKLLFLIHNCSVKERENARAARTTVLACVSGFSIDREIPYERQGWFTSKITPRLARKHLPWHLCMYCRLFITVPVLVEVFIALVCPHLRAKNWPSPITGLYDSRDSKKGCQGLAQRHGRESLMSCGVRQNTAR